MKDLPHLRWRAHEFGDGNNSSMSIGKNISYMPGMIFFCLHCEYLV
jgi:hypothetical protein